MKGKPNELDFFRTVLVKTQADHEIDETRIYATGHSHGSLMTQVLALSLPGIFAAVSPCSGILFGGFQDKVLALPEVKGRPDMPVPIWMFTGEQEDWVLPAVPDDNNDTGKTIKIWLGKNHIDTAHPIDWNTGWRVHAERWNDLCFEKDGAPMVRYTRVAYMPHATMTEMSYRIWDEFFSKFSRTEDGTLHYNGKAVTLK